MSLPRAVPLFSVLVPIALGASGCTCAKGGPQAQGDGGAATSASAGASADKLEGRGAPGNAVGLSAPIAAARLGGGDVVVAGLDVPSKAIRVQRIDSSDHVTIDKLALDDVKWSTEADLKLVPAGTGVALTWRGVRGGKLVRQLVVLNGDLAPLDANPPAGIAAASCATRDAVWFSDGKSAHGRPWTGAATRVDLGKDQEASLLCAAHRAYALLEGDEGTSILPLQGDAPRPLAILTEKDFADDEQRERAEYAVGDDLGVVRLASSGALAIRETKNGGLGPLHKLKTKIPHDDDVVAVDASPKYVIVVYTQDASDTCPKKGDAATKVTALRIDRATFEESSVTISPGACAREVGPFFTNARGDDIAVAWVERTSTTGQPRAPIAGLAYSYVSPSGEAKLARIDAPADALVDAGCDGGRCFAAVLARRPGTDGMVPGYARILRY